MDYGYAYDGPDGPVAPSAGAGAEGKRSTKVPQQNLNDFWAGLISKNPGKVFQIFPRNLYQHLLPPIEASGRSTSESARDSYKVAVDECQERVKRIVKECHRSNEKFVDADFDIEADPSSNCLKGLSTNINNASNNQSSNGIGPGPLQYAIRTLVNSGVFGQNTSIAIDPVALRDVLDNDDQDEASDSDYNPGAIHRVDYIFENPSFTVDGYSSTDVHQGMVGDCWWVAAVANLCSKPELLDHICVAKDIECGVYGFVFYRDGEWISTIVDDNLYLKSSDFDAAGDSYDPTGSKERKYRKDNQTGSNALYFAHCDDPNEIWLPLLEKAYAKVHGDYAAISGGDSGEAIEDMTGGVTSFISLSRVLSKDRLWDELLNVKKEFIFSASSSGTYGGDTTSRQGLALNHAYSVLKAVEVSGEDLKKIRLVLIRNPWGLRTSAGVGEWTGPWSDGSKEWTPYWMNKLDYRFGDDGIFWMSYDDMCRKFASLTRTRLFDNSWHIAQKWTSVNVSYVSGFMTTKFSFEVKKAGVVVIVLQQLDTRYFKGLEGQYQFFLHFLLQEAGSAPGEHLVRARGDPTWPDRSVSAEIELEAGKYEVLPKVIAKRYPDNPLVEEVVKKAALENPQKLRQIGLNYDMAHAKGGFEQAEAPKTIEEEAKPKDANPEEEKATEEVSQPTDGAAAPTEESKEPINGEKEEPNGDSADKPEEKPEAETEKSEDSAEVPEEDGAAPQDNEEEEEPAKPEEKKDANDNQGDTDQDSDIVWNAVAVIGLRVYTQDPETTIALIKPADAEEASALNIDGTHKAEATM